ncbi:MAG TPA: hypothetical protein VGX37_10295, partial [Allosphingosinicella sp.]|nr:hypothetical protein [Allosphingosinicella sp.]
MTLAGGCRSMRPLICALSLLLIAGCRDAKDGRWRLESADGHPVAADMWIDVSGGELQGGYEGCNHWGRRIENGRLLVTSELQGCPPDP